MAAYGCSPFVNATSNSFNVNTVLNHNVVDTSIPPPNFTSNNMIQTANQPAGQHFNFGPPGNISHVPGMNNTGSPFPTIPPNIMQSQNSQNFDPNARQSSPAWNNSFQNNALGNSAFMGPSHASSIQLNVAENAAFQNAPPAQSPGGPPPIWQNNNSINNLSPANYNHNSNNVQFNQPPVFHQNQMPLPNFPPVQIPQNTFPSQYSTPPVWKGNNVNGHSPNNVSTSVPINNFEKSQNTNFFQQPKVYDNPRNREFSKIQKTNVPDLKIFNNPEVVLRFGSLVSEHVNANSNQFNQSSYTGSNNSFNSQERMNHNRNFINNNSPFPHWKKESFNNSPKKDQFESRNTLKPFKSGLQFNGGRNRALSQHNHQNLIDIEVVSDNNNFNPGFIKQENVEENQSTSSQQFITERKNFAYGDTSNFTNHKRFPNVNINNNLNSYQKPSDTFGERDNFRNKKSWMTEDIEMALKERNKLFFEAKRTKDPAVWEKYHALKNKIDEDIRKAKSGSGFGFRNKSFNPRNRRPNDKDLPFSCDMCDRSFATDAEYKEHCALHIKCYYDGCNFEAHPKIVFLHQKMQHETGYAEAINKLQNDEEIKKWREERKRNFPTTENILKRKAEQAEKEARGEVVKDQNFGRFKRQRTGPGNSRFDRFKRRDRKFRQRPRNRYQNIRENLEVQYETMKVESDSEEESECHIKLPRFRGIKLELEPLPSDLTQDLNNDVQEIPTSEQTVNLTSKPEDKSEDDGEPKISISKETTRSQDCNEDDDVQEISVSRETINNTSVSQDEDDDDESPLEIPISKLPLHEAPESFDDYNDNENIVQSIKESNDTAENPAKEGSPVNNVPMKEEDNLEHSAQDNKDNDTSKRRRHERNSNRKPPRPVIPIRRKNSLLGMLLQDEIRHERNVIMQCVRHIVRNKFFGIGNNSCNGEV